MNETCPTIHHPWGIKKAGKIQPQLEFVSQILWRHSTDTYVSAASNLATPVVLFSGAKIISRCICLAKYCYENVNN